MNRIQNLHNLGQSLWYDNIQRSLLESGELAELIERGDIRGVTSNPSIFNNAIAQSQNYDAALKPMAWAGWTDEQIFYQLAVEDIRAAADLFLPLYEQTRGGDGYVSLEVSPYLAHDTVATIAEAKRLWQWVNRQNLMVKIPATPAGLPAIRAALIEGININVTLIFSLERYLEVMEVYLSALEERSMRGLPVNQIASVASFFVSRLDTKIDAALGKLKVPQARELVGKAAIANTRLAYALFIEKFQGERFSRLQKLGARVQRPLWASTSTKNPAYRDVIYIEELIGPDTINTAPPKTIDAFRDHGEAHNTLDTGLPEARKLFTDLETLGISLKTVTQELEDEGVKAFADAFTSLLKAIATKRASAQAELGGLQSLTAARIKQLGSASVAKRMFDRDPTLWTDNVSDHAEIRKRLSWLEAPRAGLQMLPDLMAFLSEIQAAGYRKVLLLGMGGSSLAPEVMSLIFGSRENGSFLGLELAIVDSTDPDQVRAAARRFPVDRTLYIVSSKSGSTAEINAFLAYFWQRARRRLGDKAGEHFIAITDPGTSLEALARQRGFRRVFSADPMVGGRYSALIAFGLVPAALLGLDVSRFLARAGWMANQCTPEIPAGRNPGLVLGAVLGEAALQGRDKLTLLADPELSSLGSWLEQLIAESSGKNGRGIVPVDIEPLARPRSYGRDRIFVHLRHSGKHDRFASQLQKAGHPVLVLTLDDEYDLATEIYRWEFAVSIACAILGVSAFDQPDVQDAKSRTLNKIEYFRQHGSLDESQPIWQGEGTEVYGHAFPGLDKSRNLPDLVSTFLQQAQAGSDYIAINAYLPRNTRILGRLQKLRASILKKTGCAVTLGFGPRFLHSTGQLHKGGPNNGVFLQITSEPAQDFIIPGEGMSFGTLERAQALGDLEALQARGRRVIRVHLADGKLEKLG